MTRVSLLEFFTQFHFFAAGLAVALAYCGADISGTG